MDGPRDPLNQSSLVDMPRPQETECHCSPALTNWDRWRHFSGFVSLPTPTPFWNWITEFESCAAIPHNSMQALLEAQLLSNQMFWRGALFWLCRPSYPTTRHTRSFIHAQVSQELHHWSIQYLQWIIITPLFCCCFLQCAAERILNSTHFFSSAPPFLHLLHWLSFECTLYPSPVRTSWSIRIQTGF